MPLGGIRKFEQQRHFPIAAVRNQRIVGIEFGLYPLAFEDPLGAQHLEDLVAYRRTVFETPGHVGTDRNVAQLLVGNDLAAQSRPIRGVLLQAH